MLKLLHITSLSMTKANDQYKGDPLRMRAFQRVPMQLILVRLLFFDGQLRARFNILHQWIGTVLIRTFGTGNKAANEQ